MGIKLWACARHTFLNAPRAKAIQTRMLSSRMHTARTLTISGGCTCPGGVPAQECTCWGYLPGGYLHGRVPAQGGVYLTCQEECTCPGGCTCPGVYLPEVPAQRVYLPRYSPSPLWTEWQTGAKILPCSKLRWRAITISRKLCSRACLIFTCIIQSWCIQTYAYFSEYKHLPCELEYILNWQTHYFPYFLELFSCIIDTQSLTLFRVFRILDPYHVILWFSGFLGHVSRSLQSLQYKDIKKKIMNNQH